jgi:hypothetical protein
MKKLVKLMYLTALVFVFLSCETKTNKSNEINTTKYTYSIVTENLDDRVKFKNIHIIELDVNRIPLSYRFVEYLNPISDIYNCSEETKYIQILSQKEEKYYSDIQKCTQTSNHTNTPIFIGINEISKSLYYLEVENILENSNIPHIY